MKYKVITDIQDWDALLKQFERITLEDEFGKQTVVENNEAAILEFSQNLRIVFWQLRDAFNMSFPEYVEST